MEKGRITRRRHLAGPICYYNREKEVQRHDTLVGDRRQCIVPTDCTHIGQPTWSSRVHKQPRTFHGGWSRACARHTDGGRVCVSASGTGGRSITEYRVPDAASPVSARAIFHRKFLRAPIAGVLHRFGAVLSRPTRRFVSFTMTFIAG